MKNSSDGTWQQEEAESVLKAAGTQDIRISIDRIQAMFGTVGGPPDDIRSICSTRDRLRG